MFYFQKPCVIQITKQIQDCGKVKGLMHDGIFYSIRKAFITTLVAHTVSQTMLAIPVNFYNKQNCLIIWKKLNETHTKLIVLSWSYTTF